MNQTIKPAYLILADGTVFRGKSIGNEGKTIGEVVFSTSMVGYQEAITDPANCGNLLVQTFPLIGNYGVNKYGNESEKAQLNGYIVRELCELPSNFRCENTLNNFLKEKNVVGICDIDTRKLTRLIREKGVMNGMITTVDIKDMASTIKEIEEFKTTKTVKKVSCKEVISYKSNNPKYNLAILDLGVKQSTVKAMTEMGCNVNLLPYDTSLEGIKALNPDGLIISDGPINPDDEEYQIVVDTLKGLMNEEIPMLGISLGHQLLAIANGAKTKKLKYGHRGANQPVINKENKRTYITTQNHGYVVDNTTLNNDICEVSYVNANDKTCAGISYKNAPVNSVQFIPDTNDGMVSTKFVYNQLFDLMKGKGE